MLNSAGRDMARANSSVLMPLAPFTRRNTRPTLATLTTLSSVGDTKYFSMMSFSTRPENETQLQMCYLPRMFSALSDTESEGIKANWVFQVIYYQLTL